MPTPPTGVGRFHIFIDETPSSKSGIAGKRTAGRCALDSGAVVLLEPSSSREASAFLLQPRAEAGALWGRSFAGDRNVVESHGLYESVHCIAFSRLSGVQLLRGVSPPPRRIVNSEEHPVFVGSILPFEENSTQGFDFHPGLRFSDRVTEQKLAHDEKIVRFIISLASTQESTALCSALKCAMTKVSDPRYSPARPKAKGTYYNVMELRYCSARHSIRINGALVSHMTPFLVNFYRGMDLLTKVEEKQFFNEREVLELKFDEETEEDDTRAEETTRGAARGSVRVEVVTTEEVFERRHAKRQKVAEASRKGRRPEIRMARTYVRRLRTSKKR
ncbi:hypothetical protein AXG93_3818s1260 [Marchantia polymorpha subsp. ruderalis]|uniref:Uncharacterized protein n=1 Tax=Marchantia polymorpha subsp. ruderalis TaxID=1480154 RepID=A0A176VGP5_MARPO|nr:hypothetical protein AXG93_3818s1260 [Marchantia polymorpha subsp. ruderalis]